MGVDDDGKLGRVYAREIRVGMAMVECIEWYVVVLSQRAVHAVSAQHGWRGWKIEFWEIFSSDRLSVGQNIIAAEPGITVVARQVAKHMRRVVS